MYCGDPLKVSLMARYDHENRWSRSLSTTRTRDFVPTATLHGFVNLAIGRAPQTDVNFALH